MKITIIGTGYVGLVTGACLAEMGNHVVCLDLDVKKIQILRDGRLPIHEPGLLEIVQGNVQASRLEFTSDVESAVRHGTLQFIAVGTPPGEDGSADLSYVLKAAKAIGERMTDYKVIISKSTVPVGTGDKVKEAIDLELMKRQLSLDYSLVSNPEFLKEGAAVEDFMRPDRIVIGANDERAILLMKALYAPFVRNHDRLQIMDVKSAEFTKYAANAMLATRISFMNELALLAEKVGADIEYVRKGIGSDPRIGTHFLYAGAGYGGSCFPKDIKALIRTAQSNDQNMFVLEAVERANERQKEILARKIVDRFGSQLVGRRFGIWGLAFKPGTDDMREAPSLVLIKELLKLGAEIVAYDPVSMPAAQQALGTIPNVTYSTSAIDALEGADALVLVTEWREFKSPDFDAIKKRLKHPVIFDGRNLYEPKLLKELGIELLSIGRKAD